MALDSLPTMVLAMMDLCRARAIGPAATLAQDVWLEPTAMTAGTALPNVLETVSIIPLVSWDQTRALLIILTFSQNACADRQQKPLVRLIDQVSMMRANQKGVTCTTMRMASSPISMLTLVDTTTLTVLRCVPSIAILRLIALAMAQQMTGTAKTVVIARALTSILVMIAQFHLRAPQLHSQAVFLEPSTVVEPMLSH